MEISSFCLVKFYTCETYSAILNVHIFNGKEIIIPDVKLKYYLHVCVCVYKQSQMTVY